MNYYDWKSFKNQITTSTLLIVEHMPTNFLQKKTKVCYRWNSKSSNVGGNSLNSRKLLLSIVTFMVVRSVVFLVVLHGDWRNKIIRKSHNPSLQFKGLRTQGSFDLPFMTTTDIKDNDRFCLFILPATVYLSFFPYEFFEHEKSQKILSIMFKMVLSHWSFLLELEKNLKINPLQSHAKYFFGHAQVFHFKLSFQVSGKFLQTICTWTTAEDIINICKYNHVTSNPH